MSTIAFPSRLLAAQGAVQIAASAPVGVDVPIDGFMADPGLSVGLEIAGDLFRTPQFGKLGFGKSPGVGGNAAAVVASLRSRLPELMCLFRPISALAPIAAKLTTDCGWMAVHDARDVTLLMSGFQKDGDLVSFVSGEMCVFHSRQL